MVWRYACGLDIVLKLFFYHFFHKLNLVIFLACFYYQREYIVGTLCAQLLLQFYANSFETLQMFFVMVWRYALWFGHSPQIIFCHFFHKLNLVIFSAFLLSKWIDSGHLVCATPPTVLCQFLSKLHRCFGHGLKICMWFGYNPQIYFYHFFRKLNLAIFTGIFTIKVNR